jgi:hypothetical protein
MKGPSRGAWAWSNGDIVFERVESGSRAGLAIGRERDQSHPVVLVSQITRPMPVLHDDRAQLPHVPGIPR